MLFDFTSSSFVSQQSNVNIKNERRGLLHYYSTLT